MNTDEAQSLLPNIFLEEVARGREADEVDRIVSGCTQRRYVTLRVNTLKSTVQDVKRSLDEHGVSWQTVSWYEDALVLPDAHVSSLRQLDIYENGSIYLQSLSSMLPALVLNPRPGADVLDMCAAPGGKTCQMSALSKGLAHITACEMHVPRAERLVFNLERQGATSVTVMRKDARTLDDFMKFDQILLDAPCTGSGTVTLPDEKLATRMTKVLLDKCTKSQRVLIRKAIDLLKPGEDLVYATCSVFERENEDVVRHALATNKVRLVPILPRERFDDIPVIRTTLDGCMCVCPNELFEGFFMAHLRKV